MKITEVFYLIVKFITFPGTILQAFLEHAVLRSGKILIEDGRYMRRNEMCGHIEHELLSGKKSASFNIVFWPFVFSFLLGFLFLAEGSITIFYLGDFFTSNTLKIPNFINFAMLYLGISLMCSMFPHTEDVLSFKDNFISKASGANKLTRIFAYPIYAVAYAGSFLQRTGLILLTTVLFSLVLPKLLNLFLPTILS